MPDPGRDAGDPVRFLKSEGVVMFTSGYTTGRGSVQERKDEVLARQGRDGSRSARAGVRDLSEGCPRQGFGFNMDDAATVLGSPLALANAWNPTPHSTSSPWPVSYWAGTPMWRMAERLKRWNAGAPPSCVVAGKCPSRCQSRQGKVGVSLRQLYG